MPRTAIKPQARSQVKTTLDKSMLRSRIIEEHHLQQSIARDEAFRKEHPDLWHRADIARMARNKAQAQLNRKLRAAGCDPVSLELSPKQKMKRLQQLKAQNRAEIASSRKRS